MTLIATTPITINDMFSLPTSSTSTYGVGSTTFATPIQPPLAFGNAETKDGKAALVLNEVAFTVYYPADISSRPKSGVDWAMRPLNGTLRGFTSFAERIPRWVLWPFVYCYAALLKIPAYPNAPLLHPKDKPWPLVIFSHGLGGSRTAYSQLCTRLAGTGKVIVAIEHRDGTSICVTTREWTEGGRRNPKVIPYIREQDLRRSSKTGQNPLVLRTEQLEFRRQEVYSAFSAFLSILRHTDQQPPQVELVDGAPIDLSSWRSDGDHTLVECAKDVTLSGHSFGGCTAFDIISTPPLAGFPRIPITKLLIYDPWLEPIPSPGPTPLDVHKTYIQRQVASNMHGGPVSEDEEATTPILPEILVVNSEAFTIWKDHFERLEDILNTWGPRATLLTLAKSAHPHFSDFLLLPLVPKRKVGLTLMECIDRLSNAFVDGRLAEQLAGENTRKMEIEIVGKRKDGRPKRELRGAVGDIIVH